MSGKKEVPNPNIKRVSIRRTSSLDIHPPQDMPLQDIPVTSSPRVHPEANNSNARNYSSQSSHSLESNLTPENHATHSSASFFSNPVRTKENYSHGKYKSQGKYSSRQSNISPGGYQDSMSAGGYSNERSVVHAGYNTQYYSPPPDDFGSYSYDNGDNDENTFSEKAVRRAFVRKVYSLIMCMMLFATAVITFMMYYDPARQFIIRNMWLVIISWALYPILMLILICFAKIRRTVPYNYFVLFLITLSLSFMAGCSAAHYNQFEVLAAFGITAILCFGLTVFAFQTKWDFTVITGGLVVASLVMLIFGMVLVFWRSKIAMIGYACLGALLGSVFFIFDTQMIIGGNHRYAIHPEEYVFAAITLFLDMINIFIMITNIIGLSRS